MASAPYNELPGPPRRIAPCTLPVLAGLHVRVQSSFISSLETRIPYLSEHMRIKAEAALNAARIRIAKLEAVACPDTDIRQAAQLLGVELITYDEFTPLTDEDINLAAVLARAGLASARDEAEKARLMLERTLNAWPPSAGEGNEPFTVSANVKTRAAELTVGLTRPASTSVARKGPTEIGCFPGLAPEVALLAAARAAAARAGELRGRADIFAAVAGLNCVPVAEHARRLVLTVLDEPRSPALSVREFCAFRGARAMPEVQAARGAGLRRVGPVQAGEAVEVEWMPPVGRRCNPAASLSARGVLCVGGYVPAKALTVVHLSSRRVVSIACAEMCVHGFAHAGELFVAQYGRDSLWHAPVSEVLAGRTDLSTFEHFSLAAKWGWAPSLDAAPAGRVAVANYDNKRQHMVVDLAARTSRLVDVGQKLPDLGGFTGVAVPGAAWAAADGYSSPVLAVASDGATREIARGLGHFPAVLPSAAAPADLARAAVLDRDARFSVGGVRGQLVDLVRPSCQSLVRLYQDVFLFWDKRRGAWVAARIVVP